MVQFKFTQVGWKSSLLVIVPVLLSRVMLDNFGWGLAVLFAIGLGVLLGIITDKFFKSVVKFQDSYLFYQRSRFSKAETIPYDAIERLTYSNATRFLKFTLNTKANTIELPPPPRLAQAKELFAWLQVKNPAIALDIMQPKTSLD